MTERERLIELLKKAPYGANAITLSDKHKDSILGEIADYLLENGVIVPPVKVETTVYCTDSYRHLIKPLEIFGFDCTKRICKYYCIGEDYTPEWFNLAEIGKTVFLTREEAEKALKESEQK